MTSFRRGATLLKIWASWNILNREDDLNQSMYDDLMFEDVIKDFSPPEKFLARQLREVQRECEARGRACSATIVPSFTKKQIAVGTAGIGGIATAVSIIAQVVIKLLEK